MSSVLESLAAIPRTDVVPGKALAPKWRIRDIAEMEATLTNAHVESVVKVSPNAASSARADARIWYAWGSSLFQREMETATGAIFTVLIAHNAANPPISRDDKPLTFDEAAAMAQLANPVTLVDFVREFWDFPKSSAKKNTLSGASQSTGSPLSETSNEQGPIGISMQS